jgi:hypothetical protein
MYAESSRPTIAITVDQMIPLTVTQAKPPQIWIRRNNQVQLAREWCAVWDMGGISEVRCHLVTTTHYESYLCPPTFDLLISCQREEPEFSPSHFDVCILPVQGVDQLPDGSFLFDSMRLSLKGKMKTTLHGEVYEVRLGLHSQESRLSNIYHETTQILDHLWALFWASTGYEGFIGWLQPNNGPVAMLLATLIYILAFRVFLSMGISESFDVAATATYLLHLSGAGLVLIGFWGCFCSPWFLVLHGLGTLLLMASFAMT